MAFNPGLSVLERAVYGPPVQILMERDNCIVDAARPQKVLERASGGCTEKDVRTAQISPASGLLGSA
jgi:hypothetical protein